LGGPSSVESHGASATYKMRPELLIQGKDKTREETQKEHDERLETHTKRIQKVLKEITPPKAKWCRVCLPKRKKILGRGLCSKHYYRLKTYGSPYKVKVRIFTKGYKYRIIDEREEG